MTGPIERAYIEILPQLRNFGSQVNAHVRETLRQTEGELGSMNNHVTEGVHAAEVEHEGMFSRIKEQAKELAAFMLPTLGAVEIVKFFHESITAAEEAQKSERQTEAVLKSTGEAAHVTAGEVANYADKLSKQTGITAETIRGNENLLLTFTNVRNEVGKGNDIFTQATKTVLDMSVALKEDGKSASIQLGKALNDPIKGITALRRVGVQFTDQQKEQIKTMVASGNTLGAQKLILHELNREFGGSAAAQATASSKMKASWESLKIQIGTGLLPIMDKVFSFVSEHIIPTVQHFVDQIQHGQGPVAGFVHALAAIIAPAIQVIRAVNPIGLIFATLRPILPQVTSAIHQVATVLGNVLATALETIGKILPTLIQVFTEIARVVISLVLRAMKLLAPLLPQIAALFGQIADAVIMFIHKAILPALPVIKQIYMALQDLAITIIHAVMPILPVIVNAFRQLLKAIAPLIPVILSLIRDALRVLLPILRLLLPIVAQVAKVLIVVLVVALKVVIAVIALTIKAIREIANVLIWFWKSVIVPTWHAIENATRTAWNAILGAFRSAWNWIHNTFSSLWSNLTRIIMAPINWVKNNIGNTWDSIKNTFMSAWRWVRNSFSNVWNNVRDVIMAPFRWVVDHGLQPVWNAITRSIHGATGTFRSAWASVRSVFSAPVKWVVDHIWNSGIAQFWNWLSNKIGGALGHLGTISTRGWAEGGVVGKVLHAARGAIAPGYAPGVDSQLAMVSPGEGILRPEVTRQLGHERIYRWNRNRRIDHFANGGVSGYDPGGISGPKLGSVYAPAAGGGITGITNDITSIAGNVSNALNPVAWWNWVKKKFLGFGKIAASALHSLSGNPWGSTVLRAPGLMMNAVVGNIKDKVMSYIKGAINKGLSIFGISLPGTVIAGKGNIGGQGTSTAGYSPVLISWAKTALADAHLPFTWAAAIARRALFESSGNPRAINLSDANARAGHPSMGLMQTIQSTFDYYALPGHHNIWNPVDNIIAASRYISSQYGSIWAIDPPKLGYARGAWKIPNDQTARIHAGEMIIPKVMADKVRAGVTAGAGSALDEVLLANAIARAMRGLTLSFDGAGLARIVTQQQGVQAVRGIRR